MKLRNYQLDTISSVQTKWSWGQKNICLVLPTGAGKTVVAAHTIKQQNVPTMCIAHRQELIVQISETLAAVGIQHHVIAPTSVVKFCTARHIKRFGQSFTHGQDVMVASVQTLVRRAPKLKHLFGRVKLWFTDECHHCLPDNLWGKGIALMPETALGLGVTATPLRCDRKGLDGVFDDLVIGPTMRDLISQGHLTDYRIFCPPVSINRDHIRTSKSSGEFIRADLIDETHRSSIVGDVVGHYQRIAGGKRGLTFAVDLASARQITDAYNAAGVPALYVDAETPDRERNEASEKLRTGEVKQLVNVDLFGEGYDVPAVEVVSMARPTQSYGLYSQQFGRSLRLFENKTHAIIIDHVGNVVTHGLPDQARHWTLEGGRVRDSADGTEALTVCAACMQPRPRVQRVCPYCAHINEPQSRAAPAAVDGDLMELDPAVLAQMRGDVVNIESGQPAIPYGATGAIVGRKIRDWGELCEAQAALRESMAYWSGLFHHGYGEDDQTIQRRFYLTFNIDMLSAQALRRADAEKLNQQVRSTFT